MVSIRCSFVSSRFLLMLNKFRFEKGCERNDPEIICGYSSDLPVI